MPLADADLIDTLQRLAMALGIGFLMGVERGFRHRGAPEGSRAAGLRTHAVIGVLGGLSGALLPSIGAIGFAALTLAFSAALIAFKVRESIADNDISVTGTIAAIALYALGAYAMNADLRLVAAVGVTLVGLLALKEALHGWLNKLTWVELRSALLILAATAIVLPVLPGRPLDPWGVVNPRELWVLTILVAGASFAGYVAVRALGGGVGLLAGAAAGALVSSTVVTAELGRRVGAAETTASTAAAGAALAAAVSVTRVTLFIAAAATAALPQVGPALGAAALAFLLGAWLLSRRDHNPGKAEAARTLRSPLDLRSVLQFAGFLALVTVCGRLIADAYGQAGLLPFAAAAGLADVDAVALAAGALVRDGLDAGLAGQAILVAVLVNTFSKGAIAVFAGGWRYGALYLAAATAAALAGALAFNLAGPLFARFSSEGSLAMAGFG
jgi:uncharacterized membrane protein (DUF4010 family)